MTKRSPVGVLFLIFFTFGIYGLIWYVKTKNEMNQFGANIPTAWLLIIPFVNLYWLWVYANGVSLVTKGAFSPIACFLLKIFLAPIAPAIFQNEFNKVGREPESGLAAAASV